MAGDLLERRQAGADEALEKLVLSRDPEGDALAEFRRKQLRAPPAMTWGPARSGRGVRPTALGR